MNRGATFCFGLFLVSLLAGPATASRADVGIARIESDILSSRRAIHSYDMVVEVNRSLDGKRSHAVYEFWESAGNRRQKLTDDAGTTEVCVNGSNGFYYSATLGQFENSDRSKWPSIRIDPVSSIVGNPTYRMRDPMTIMFSSYLFTWYTGFGLEKFINGPNRVEFDRSSATWHGAPSVKISFKYGSVGTRFEYEVVPSLGNSIIVFRGSGEREEPDGRKVPFEVACVCSEVREVAPSIWFPADVHGTKTVDRKVEDDEHLKIHFKTVNSVIPDRTFEIAGLGLPSGVLIADESKPWRSKRSATTHPSVLVWDGEAVRPWTSADSASVAMSSVPVVKAGGRLARWRVWASAVLLVIGIVLMALYISSAIRARRSNQIR